MRSEEEDVIRNSRAKKWGNKLGRLRRDVQFHVISTTIALYGILSVCAVTMISANVQLYVICGCVTHGARLPQEPIRSHMLDTLRSQYKIFQSTLRRDATQCEVDSQCDCDCCPRPTSRVNQAECGFARELEDGVVGVDEE